MPEALQYTFMQHAALAALLVSMACGIVGTLVVLNRLVFLGAGIAHAAYGGIGLGVFLGINPMLSGALFSLAASLGLGALVRRSRQRADTLIGVLWAIGMALGVLFVDLAEGYHADLLGYLFGSLLAIPAGDLVAMLALDLLLLLFVGLAYRPLLALSFDEEFARVRNVPVQVLSMMQVALVGLTVVLTMRLVGLILVLSLLTIPAAIAVTWCRGLLPTMALASGLAAIFSLGGLALAYRLDLTSGATIILFAATGYLLNSLLHRCLRPPAAATPPPS